ncbi:hypothetical protein GWK47_040832 [Chionoecetes opilio]|uniref:Uncharacterized protein n=1 Tax=Chionoecetes opilio TaxID=41210 RepID=A0A8J5CZR0_CHIOP|nr:hypothetical protein GWK47_040832 [Chionoecetes opilio]
MVTRAEQSNEESTQDSEENFTEADSMAAEVGEEDIEEEEEDIDVQDVINLDEEEPEAEADRQASEAEERRGGDNSNSSSSSMHASAEVSSVPSSTPSSMPSSSHQRRITPITWDRHGSPQRFHRGNHGVSCFFSLKAPIHGAIWSYDHRTDLVGSNQIGSAGTHDAPWRSGPRSLEKSKHRWTWLQSHDAQSNAHESQYPAASQEISSGTLRSRLTYVEPPLALVVMNPDLRKIFSGVNDMERFFIKVQNLEALEMHGKMI